MLIVDDAENHRRTLAIGLRLESFDVEEASNAAEALSLLEGPKSFQFAIIDLMMPGLNGVELARRMRVRAPHVRVVLTSAYHLSEQQLARADVGALGFVPKPYRLDDLVGFLRSHRDG